MSDIGKIRQQKLKKKLGAKKYSEYMSKLSLKRKKKS